MSICTGSYMADLMDEQISWEPDCFECGDSGSRVYSQDAEGHQYYEYCECAAGKSERWHYENPAHTCALPPHMAQAPEIPF